MRSSKLTQTLSSALFSAFRWTATVKYRSVRPGWPHWLGLAFWQVSLLVRNLIVVAYPTILLSPHGMAHKNVELSWGPSPTRQWFYQSFKVINLSRFFGSRMRRCEPARTSRLPSSEGQGADEPLSEQQEAVLRRLCSSPPQLQVDEWSYKDLLSTVRAYRRTRYKAQTI